MHKSLSGTAISRFLTAFACFAGLGGAAPASAEAFEPGVGVRVYSIAEDVGDVPTLAPNQTPNFDQLLATLHFPDRPPWVDAVPGAKLIAIETQINCPTPGKYPVRLAGGGALRLQVWGGEGVETPVDGPGVVESHIDWTQQNFVKVWVQQVVVDDRDAALSLEWQVPGTDEFVPIPPEYWRSPADPTRVTSPGPKRLSNSRRPGDGKPVAGVHPGYDLTTIRPTDSKPSVGAMTFTGDGRLIVGTFSPLQRSDVALPDIDSKEPDKLYEVRGAAGDDPDAYELVPVADGLLEPSGLCAVGEALYVSHRKAVTRLTDQDGDGYFETSHDVASGWEGWNYHQFTFGLVHRDGKLYAALSTAMAPPGWEGMGTNAGPNGPMRGGMIEVDLDTETARVFAGGFRTPNTVALGPDDDLFYADNQGTWFPTSVLSHVVAGRFYGHFNRTNAVPKLADRFPDGGHASSFSDQLRSRRAVYLPQNEIINSPSKALLIEDGPFAGQMFLGEITSGGIRRVQLEKVNGQWQGAVFRFTQGLECGVNRLDWGPDGALYIGGIGAGGNWAWNGTRFGLQRMVPNGRTVFEMHSVHATTDGLHIRFTKPVDPDWLADPANYAAEQWNYLPTKEYGGRKRNHQTLDASAATPDDDGRGVRIVIDGLKADRCVYLRTQPTSLDGEPIWSTEAYYTLNEFPRAEPVEAGTINGKTLVEAGDTDVSLGLGVLPPADGVPLIGRSFRGAMYRTNVEPKQMAREGAATPDELREMSETDGVEVSAELGDLHTATEFGDHRLHVEWLAPGRADGGYSSQTGNSGVYIQGRYELQILATPAGAAPLEAHEAGALYGVKPADLNASAGPGRWQSYDIWFRAARFDGDGNKTADARLTAYWNGKLIHDDVRVAEPTGSMKQHGEPIGAGEKILLGPLRLQGHGSDADANVRFRNVWVAPLEPTHYVPGPAVELFDGETFGGWVVRGGKGEFSVEDGQVVGVGVPHSGGNTFLVTEKTYADFELTYEVKLQEGLNSGVQIRSHVDGGIGQRDGKVRGYQVEADPSDRRYGGGVYDEGRRGWIAPLIEKPYARTAWRRGEWNRVVVVAQGPVIRTWVNGVPAASVMDAKTAAGHIGLQVHAIGARDDRPEVRFRNLTLRPLSPRND